MPSCCWYYLHALHLHSDCKFLQVYFLKSSNRLIIFTMLQNELLIRTPQCTYYFLHMLVMSFNLELCIFFYFTDHTRLLQQSFLFTPTHNVFPWTHLASNLQINKNKQEFLPVHCEIPDITHFCAFGYCCFFLSYSISATIWSHMREYFSRIPSLSTGVKLCTNSRAPVLGKSALNY